MITGVGQGVRFYMDSAARDVDVIYMHPLVNDRTVMMARGDFRAFLERIGCEINWI